MEKSTGMPDCCTNRDFNDNAFKHIDFNLGLPPPLHLLGRL